MGRRRSTDRVLRVWLIGLVLLALSLITPVSATPTQSTVPSVWFVLNQFERDALADYEFHRGTSDVKQRGQLLLKLAASQSFRDKSKSCSAAARTLGFMVTGYYESLRKAQISTDWFYFSKRYIHHRAACARDLEVDISQYHLPRWFGR